MLWRVTFGFGLEKAGRLWTTRNGEEDNEIFLAFLICYIMHNEGATNIN